MWKGRKVPGSEDELATNEVFKHPVKMLLEYFSACFCVTFPCSGQFTPSSPLLMRYLGCPQAVRKQELQVVAKLLMLCPSELVRPGLWNLEQDTWLSLLVLRSTETLFLVEASNGQVGPRVEI